MENLSYLTTINAIYSNKPKANESNTFLTLTVFNNNSDQLLIKYSVYEIGTTIMMGEKLLTFFKNEIAYFCEDADEIGACKKTIILNRFLRTLGDFREFAMIY